MTFKELRQNLPIHIFDKKAMTYTQGKVVNTGTPRINTQQNQQPAFGTMPQMQMLVDVTVDYNGKTETFALDVNANVAAVGTCLVSTDKADILNELHATAADDEKYLAGVEDEKKMRQERLDKCKSLIADLDTAYKERQETENRFKTIENTQKEQGNKLDRILEILSKDKEQ